MPWKSRIYGMLEYATTEIMTPIYGKYLCHNMARKCVWQENVYGKKKWQNIYIAG